MPDKITIAADDTLAQQHSDQLKQLMIAEIAERGGWISFAGFMQRCLYQPGLGYYSAGSHKLGQGGDFTTAPETTPLFAYALVNHIVDAAAQIPRFELLEFGAGSGRLAVDILTRLAQLGQLPDRYLVVETSADLQQRQQALITQEIPKLAPRVQWLTALPTDFCGIMLANEVCDAMPVHLLRLTKDRVQERGVSVDNDQFCWQDRPPGSEVLAAKAETIPRPREGEYLTEVSLAAPEWLSSVASTITQGAIFIIDYGYPFAEYYRPERRQGTLRCYYRQQAHDNPLILPGLQDITAHVDFTSLAEAALEAGLTVAGFHEQGDFLLAGGIAEIAAGIEQEADTLTWLKHSSAIKQLLMPGAMGHQFKVLSLTRNMATLPRLSLHDRRYQL